MSLRQGRWLVALLGLALGGCTSFIARQIERPGRDNRAQLEPFRKMLEQGGFRQETMRTSQGVHIAYWVGAPATYKVEADIHEQRRADKPPVLQVAYGLRMNPDRSAPPSHGSVVLLHPWGTEGSAMAIWGLMFASAGYNVVLPDMRSNGRSEDAPVGYGPREADDLVDLVRDLQDQRRLPGPLYLVGASYGGTVAMFAAPKLPQVRGVIAMEPYIDAADVIRRAPASGLFGHAWMAALISRREMDKAIVRAGKQLDVDLAAVNPSDGMQQVQACTLILRGTRDVLIADGALRDLSRRAPRVRYVEISDEGHLSLPLRTDRLFAPALRWIDALPTGGVGACPSFTPLPFVVAKPSPSGQHHG